MLTKADDYPVHQTPEPIAIAGTDRNFYDRYFFNGYTPDGSIYFAAALGVYPALNVMDAAFCVIVDGVQHNLRASKALNMERLDLTVGPITVEILEPLQKLGLKADSAEHGIKADLVFDGRTAPIQEPRFIRRNGPRTFMDYTRLTQNGSWSGQIEVAGETIEVMPNFVKGTRDRSWGVRPVGPQDSAPPVPPMAPQFFWLWAPLNFDNHITLYHNNADGEGVPWNTNGVIAEINGGVTENPHATISYDFIEGTRHIKKAEIIYPGSDGDTVIELNRKFEFCMSGLGYTHPQWGHGHYHGDLDVGYDSINLEARDMNDMMYLHVQAFCDAKMTTPGGKVHKGCGALEQLIIGAYEPDGLTGFLGPD